MAVPRDNIQLLPIYEVPGTILSALQVTTCERVDTDVHVSGEQRRQRGFEPVQGLSRES